MNDSRHESAPWRVPRALIGPLFLAAFVLSCGGASNPAREPTDEKALLKIHPYLTGAVESGGPTGVLKFDRAGSAGGYNLFTQPPVAEAFLTDMDGNLLHRWLWPSRNPVPLDSTNSNWHFAHVFENGDLLAVFSYSALVKLDRVSRVIWTLREPVHHVFDTRDDGSIVAIIQRKRDIDIGGRIHEFGEDHLALIDSDGRLTDEFSILGAFRDSPYADLYADFDSMVALFDGDVMHTNLVQELRRNYPGNPPAFRKGNFLVSVRNRDALAIVDSVTRKVAWTARGPWKRQHTPRMLDDGSILLFDNVGLGKRSRALIYDPRSDSVTWECSGPPEKPFFSEAEGSAARLHNGNYLIDDTNHGRVVEVTPGGEVVWEFVNPNVHPESGLRSTIPNITRLPAGFPLDWLDPLHRPDR